MPGVETIYLLFLALVKQDRLSLARLLSMLCERPAEIADVPKGRLEIDRDADIVVVDFKDLTKVSAERLHSRCGWTAFEGHQAIFPSLVFLRGERIVDGSQLLVTPGTGDVSLRKDPESDEVRMKEAVKELAVQVVNRITARVRREQRQHFHQLGRQIGIGADGTPTTYR